MDKNYSKAMTELIFCSLNSKPADETITENKDLKKLFFLAKSHSLAALVFLSLSKTKAFADADYDTKKLWQEYAAKVQRKEILLSAERTALESEFEKNGIWYLPLKGSILNKLYPKIGTREMSDVDIFYDKSKREEVKKIFLSVGYEKDDGRDYYEDAYLKKPMLHFEMHTELFEKNKYPVLAEYYQNFQEKLITQDKKEYAKKFSDEDFYIFIIAHAYKHFSNNGTGMRTLVDIFLLSQKNNELRESDYVVSELQKLGAYDFERTSVSLGNKLFDSKEELDDSEEKLLSVYLDSSTYGSQEAKLNRNIQANGSKLVYIIKRLFPGREYCRVDYPFFYEHPIFLPAFWVYRFFKPKKHKGKLKNEINYLTKK